MKSTCRAQECDRNAKVRGMCNMHYLRAWRAGAVEPVEARCLDCDELIVGTNGGRRRCESCATEYARRRQSEWHKANPRPRKVKRVRSCYLCGGETPPTTRGRRKCRSCEQESAVTQCVEVGCGRPARARKLCAMHYKRQARADGRISDSSPWNERRRANYARRRALKKGSQVGEPFTNLEIFDRDSWKCHLCRRKVSRSLLHPHPLSASLDHLVPLSEGGAHSRENVALAHLRCNVQKGVRAAGEQLALIG